ncbi:MAG TPA: M14 family zinc carboxypeptidase, partial [Blastocatellia bacterium]|nr:M14 family zinc carboxypeptidase [Blastocatellia bacterium]
MRRNHNHLLRTLVIIATLALTFCLMSATMSATASLKASQSTAQSPALSARLAARQRTEAKLRSTDPDEFLPALASLAERDEPGLLPVWDAAIHNQNDELRNAAWNEFRPVRTRLERKELVPQVVRVTETGESVQRIADDTGLDVTVWSEGPDGAVAAAPPYLIEAMRARGMNPQLLYNTVEEWQQARLRHDPLAESITPEYQRSDNRQIRIAVVDLTRSGSPQTGYSNWLGDGEDVLMKNESFLAHLDIASLGDGSDQSIQSYVEEQYTRRGYALAGFFTPEEFSNAVGRYFPGESFDAGRRRPSVGGVRLALAEGAFHSYQETLSEFTALAQAHPDIARLVNLGTSYEGRQMFGLKISLDPGNND